MIQICRISRDCLGDNLIPNRHLLILIRIQYADLGDGRDLIFIQILFFKNNETSHTSLELSFLWSIRSLDIIQVLSERVKLVDKGQTSLNCQPTIFYSKIIFIETIKKWLKKKIITYSD